MGEVRRYRREFPIAAEQYQHAAAIARASGNRDSLLWSILGEVATNIEAGEPSKSSAVLREMEALLAEPGYSHPLETAHLGLLKILSSLMEMTSTEVLQQYESLGIKWPSSYITSFIESGQISGTTPI